MKIQDACIHPSMHDCRRKNINLQNSSSRHCYTDNELTGPSSSLISINHLDRAPYHIHPCMHAYSLHHVHRAPDPFQQPPPHPCPCRTSTLLCLVQSLSTLNPKPSPTLTLTTTRLATTRPTTSTTQQQYVFCMVFMTSTIRVLRILFILLLFSPLIYQRRRHYRGVVGE